ncbi:MAG: 50S ribosomal protein L6 [Dehalococcoidia bacterium]
MSRVGRLPIPIPSGVQVTLSGQHARVQGPKGTLDHDVHTAISVTLEDDSIVVTRPSDSPSHRALHGLTRALLANMVTGVSTGFRKSLEIAGTGYRAELRGTNLMLNLGYSHPIEMEPLPGVSFEVETPTRLHIVGIDKQAVGQQAALVREKRPPEPYRGKGIRYSDEVIRRKAGKTGR